MEKKTRVRAKRTPDVTPVDELLGGAVCCVPVLMATFRRETLVRLENRHVGRFCAGQLDSVDIREWRNRKAS